MESKNYYLKIPVRVRVRAYVCAYNCQDSTGHGTAPDTGHHRKKRGTQAKRENKICDCWEI